MKNRILKANDITVLANAFKNIDKTSSNRYMASGVTITINNINKEGFNIVEEFMIVDGLSQETINAIKNDIKRSYDLRLQFAKI